MGLFDLFSKAKHVVDMAVAVGRTARDRVDPPPKPLPRAEMRDYTAEELATFDGRDPERPILLAIRGTIYDVTRGRSFYGPSGPYAAFAGKDCARALALDSLEPADARPDVDDLPPERLRRLEDWVDTFELKYGAIGRIVAQP
jgi:membrane-associated progesterone receptor component